MQFVRRAVDFVKFVRTEIGHLLYLNVVVVMWWELGQEDLRIPQHTGHGQEQISLTSTQ